MLYFVQILYLISSASAFSWSIDGEVKLGRDLKYKYKLDDLGFDRGVTSRRKDKYELIPRFTNPPFSSQQSEESSDDTDDDVTETTFSTTRRRHKNRHKSSTTSKLKRKLKRISRDHRHTIKNSLRYTTERYKKSKIKRQPSDHFPQVILQPPFDMEVTPPGIRDELANAFNQEASKVLEKFVKTDKDKENIKKLFPALAEVLEGKNKTGKLLAPLLNKTQSEIAQSLNKLKDEFKNHTKHEFGKVVNQTVDAHHNIQQVIKNKTEHEMGHKFDHLKNKTNHHVGKLNDTLNSHKDYLKNKTQHHVGKLEEQLKNKTDHHVGKLEDTINSHKDHFKNKTEHLNGKLDHHIKNKTDHHVGKLEDTINSHKEHLKNKTQHHIDKLDHHVKNKTDHHVGKLEDTVNSHKEHFKNKTEHHNGKLDHHIKNKTDHHNGKLDHHIKNKTDHHNGKLDHHIKNKTDHHNGKLDHHIKNKTDHHVGKLEDTINSHKDHFKNKTDHHVGILEDTLNSHKENLKNKTHHHAGILDHHLKNKTDHHIGKLDDTINSHKEHLKNNTLHQMGKLDNHLKNKTDHHLGKLENTLNSHKEHLKNKTQHHVDKLDHHLKNKTDHYIGTLENQFKNKTQDIAHNQEAIRERYKLHKDKLHHQHRKHHAENVSKDEFGKFPFRMDRNSQIATFAKEILKNTLRVFTDIKNKTKEHHWKKQVNRVARGYEDKYKEFLRATRHQKIKTRFGPQKVILNAIDMSNRIVNRLLNYVLDDMEKKGLLRNANTPNIFHRALSKEAKSEFNRACMKLGICVTHPGFTYFVVDILTTIASLKDSKFKHVMFTLLDSIRNTDFNRTLGGIIYENMLKTIDQIDSYDLEKQRAMIVIIKNHFTNRNMPLVVYEDSNPVRSKLNTTILFMEIVNILDERVPDTTTNVRKWLKIDKAMKEYAEDDDDAVDVRETMNDFVTQIKDSIDRLDGNAWTTVILNTQKILNGPAGKRWMG